MCLAIPGQVVGTYEKHGLRMGQVRFGGVEREVCLEYLPAADVDDYVLVHVGFALSVVDEEEARRTYAVLKELEELHELEAPQPDAGPRES